MDKKKKSYELRLTGLSWIQVAKEIGANHAGTASSHAQNYARSKGLDFPPQSIDHRLRR